MSLLTMRKLRDGEKRRTCQVQPHAAEPNGCSAEAGYEVMVFDATSWLCERHFWEIKAQLDAQAPISIRPDGETVH